LLKNPEEVTLARLCSMRTERRLDTLLIRLYGEFDLSCERPFRTELAAALDAETSTLIFDIRELSYIDSTGLKVLVDIDRLAREDGFDFAIMQADGPLTRVFEETGLLKLLPLVDPAEAAVPGLDG
jgi:anti-sigma B factor antagonist